MLSVYTGCWEESLTFTQSSGDLHAVRTAIFVDHTEGFKVFGNIMDGVIKLTK